MFAFVPNIFYKLLRYTDKLKESDINQINNYCKNTKGLIKNNKYILLKKINNNKIVSSLYNFNNIIKLKMKQKIINSYFYNAFYEKLFKKFEYNDLNLFYNFNNIIKLKMKQKIINSYFYNAFYEKLFKKFEYNTSKSFYNKEYYFKI